jgi:hypothetical protein
MRGYKPLRSSEAPTVPARPFVASVPSGVVAEGIVGSRAVLPRYEHAGGILMPPGE